jgi:hypothetical protein
MRKSRGVGCGTRRAARSLIAAVCWGFIGAIVLITPAWAAPLFGAPRAYPVGTSPVGIGAGEFNDVPGLDLVTGNEGNTVTILANHGDGVFDRAANVPVEDRFTITGIVTGVFNDDTLTDFAISAQDIQSFPDFNGAVVIHRSTNVFRYDPVPVTVGLFPQCIISADLTGDDIPDLASCDTTTDNQGLVSLLRGNADYTFAVPTQIALGAIVPRRLAGADIDRDDHPDLLVADSDANAVWILYGMSSEPRFAPPQQLAVITAPSALLVAQFGNDTLPGIAVASRTQGKVVVFRQLSPRQFDSGTPYPVGLFPVDLAAAKFAGNATLDLVTANNGSGDVTLLLGNADGTFRPGETVRVGDGPVAIVAGNFNDDEKPDFATANQDDQAFGRDTQSVSVVLNGVSPPFTATPSPTVTKTLKRTATPTKTPPPTGTATRTRTPTMGTPLPTPTPAGPGDTNCDGKIDERDVITVIDRIFDGTSGCLNRPATAADIPLFVRLVTATQG